MTIVRSDQLDITEALVLVIDIQEKLVPMIRHYESIVSACVKLLEGVRPFDLPVLATEQYPKGLGFTVKPIQRLLETASATVLEKPTFSAWVHEPVREALLKLERAQIIVTGIESHVCVQQTVLDLLSRDYDVFVCADAVGSRGRTDHETALRRMAQAGAFVTTVESVLFELCHRCDTPQFKSLIEVIKATPPTNV
jgi:isochorismate hydrolase